MYLMDTTYGSGSAWVWERPEPQPRAAPVRLSREKIAAAAVRLADAQGLDGLSIRKLATELGVGPMRLYDYVANKDELLDLMVDAVYAEIAAAEHGEGWRATAGAIARATREAALAHEWFTALLGGRPRLGPHALAVGEATAAALSQAPGVRNTDDLHWVIGTFNAVVIGALRNEIIERRSDTDERSWQKSHGPYLMRMFATGRYPTLSRLVHDGPHLSAEDAFDHRLTTVLDGIANRRGKAG
jgi:AcrR family transcriptional regulator